MTKKEMKREYKRKISEIKSVYKKEKRVIKADYAEQKTDYYKRTDKQGVINPPKRPLLEEIGNAITHGLGAIFSVVAYLLMLFSSETTAEILSASIYFFGMLMMFLMSCLYHSFRHGSAVKRVFRRFDYSGIYLLIGATFTPILLCEIGGTFGLVFFIVQWLIIATGITLVGVFGSTRFKALHMTLYITLGWSGLLLIPTLLNALPLFLYILAGGVAYSLGIIPFALRKGASHFIWHFFVLGGAIIQWLGIYLYIYL